MVRPHWTHALSRSRAPSLAQVGTPSAVSTGWQRGSTNEGWPQTDRGHRLTGRLCFVYTPPHAAPAPVALGSPSRAPHGLLSAGRPSSADDGDDYRGRPPDQGEGEHPRPEESTEQAKAKPRQSPSRAAKGWDWDFPRGLILKGSSQNIIGSCRSLWSSPKCQFLGWGELCAAGGLREMALGPLGFCVNLPLADRAAERGQFWLQGRGS